MFVTAEKYCQLLKDEGGIDLLERVMRDPRPIDAIKQLAEQVVTFINNQQNLPPSDSVDNGAVNGDIENGNE